jgi:hypothetical protein
MLVPGDIGLLKDFRRIQLIELRRESEFIKKDSLQRI